MDGVIGGTHEEVVNGETVQVPNRKYFYHTDQVGSVRAVSNADGQVVWSAEYLAFGSKYGENVTDQSFTPDDLGFTGKAYDADMGLYYFNARWYDSELGRFISEDPVFNPNMSQLYIYCVNKPLVSTDPTGKTPCNITGGDDPNYTPPSGGPPKETPPPDSGNNNGGNNNNNNNNDGSSNQENKIGFPGIYLDSDVGLPCPVITVVDISTEVTLYEVGNKLYIDVKVDYSSVTSVASDWGGSGATEQVTITGKVSISDDKGTSNNLDDSTVYQKDFGVGAQTASNNLDKPTVEKYENEFKVSLPTESVVDIKPDLLNIKVDLKVSVGPELSGSPMNFPVTPIIRSPSSYSKTISIADIKINEPGGATSDNYK